MKKVMQAAVLSTLVLPVACFGSPSFRSGVPAATDGKLLSEILPKDSPLLTERKPGSKMIITTEGVMIGEDPMEQEGSKRSLQIAKLIQDCRWAQDEAFLRQLQAVSSDRVAAQTLLFRTVPDILTFAAALENEQKSLNQALDGLIKLISFLQGSSYPHLRQAVKDQLESVNALRKNLAELTVEVQKTLRGDHAVAQNQPDASAGA